MLRLWLLAAALLLTGCQTVTQVGAETVYRFAWWVPVGTALGGTLLGVAGVVFLVGRLNARLGIIGTIMGTLLVAVFAPSIYSDRVTVSPEGFTVSTGFWWHATQFKLRFADLERIQLVTEDRGSRDHDVQHELACYTKDGRREMCPVGDLMKRGAEAAILQEAQKQGVRIDR